MIKIYKILVIYVPTRGILCFSRSKAHTECMILNRVHFIQHRPTYVGVSSGTVYDTTVIEFR